VDEDSKEKSQLEVKGYKRSHLDDLGLQLSVDDHDLQELPLPFVARLQGLEMPGRSRLE